MAINADEFLKDLTTQREHYEQMIEATREQNRLIDTANMDALLAILKKKNEHCRAHPTGARTTKVGNFVTSGLHFYTFFAVPLPFLHRYSEAHR